MLGADDKFRIEAGIKGILTLIEIPYNLTVDDRRARKKAKTIINADNCWHEGLNRCL